MTGLDRLQSRALALFLLAGGLLLVWYGAVLPYLGALARSDQQLTQVGTQLQLYRNIAARTVDAQPNAMPDTLLLPGGSTAGAAAYLQQQAGLLSTTAGTLLLSFELLPSAGAGDEEGAPLQAVAGRMRVTANTASLRSLLHAMETHRPLLQIDNVFVRARNDQDTVPGGHLDVQLDVTGYRPMTEQTPP